MHPATSPSPAFTFRLNGQTVSVEGASLQQNLLNYIRGLGLTGAKEGCAEGECGACTVVLVKPNGEGSEYRTVNSCLMLLPMAAGQEIYTVESLGKPCLWGQALSPANANALHPVQQSLVETGGSQCGYCTPGFVMSLFAEYYRPGRGGPCAIEALGGNLCRCTGYRPIRDAAISLGLAPDDHFQRRLAQPAPPLNQFSYTNGETSFSLPTTLAAFHDEMRAYPAARFISGGTDLVVEANLRGACFPRLISLEAIPELRGWAETEDHVGIGAALTLNEIAARWVGAPAAFREWLTLFASPPVRNRATLGGNLATASPIGDAAPLLLALDSQLLLSGSAGQRTVPLKDFFAAYRKTILQPGEIIASIRIPKPLAGFVRFYKVAKRKLDDISTVAACLAMSLDSAGHVEKARFAYGGVAEIPLRILGAEQAIEGRRWSTSAAHLAQEEIARAVRPISDHRGSAAYRLAMAKSLVEKFAWETLEEAA